MNLQTLEESNDVYRRTHEARPDYFKGYSIVKHVYDIGNLIKDSNIETVIDYGCGKARAWKQYNLEALWELRETYLYDPGVAFYDTKPICARDLVICTDVMEHIPEHLVDDVLADICSLANKAVFFNISTRPSTKILVDGSNAHATVKPQRWWQQKINRLDKFIITKYT